MTTQNDLRTLCNALGFMTVLVKNETLPQDGAETAAMFARMIETFCRDTDAPGATPDNGGFALRQRMAAAIVSVMQERGSCAPSDLEAKGFSPDEIARCWPMAKALAHVMLNMADG